MTRRGRTLAIAQGGQLLASGWSTVGARQPSDAVAVSTADIDREIWTVLVRSVRNDNITVRRCVAGRLGQAADVA